MNTQLHSKYYQTRLEYRQKNKEKLRGYYLKSRDDSARNEHRKRTHKEYYQKNKKNILKKQREWQEKNKDEISRKRREKYILHPPTVEEKALAALKMRRKRAANPEGFRQRYKEQNIKKKSKGYFKEHRRKNIHRYREMEKARRERRNRPYRLARIRVRLLIRAREALLVRLRRILRKKKRNTSTVKKTKKCLVCGITFISSRKRTKLCSVDCQIRQKRIKARSYQRQRSETPEFIHRVLVSQRAKRKKKPFNPKYVNNWRWNMSKILDKKRQKAKARGLEVLDKKPFLEWYKNEPKVCRYCGIPQKLTGKINFDIRHSHRLEIERIDNTKGYILGNIGLACARCNMTKSNFFTEEEMTEIAQKYIKPRWMARLQHFPKSPMLSLDDNV